MCAEMGRLDSQRSLPACGGGTAGMSSTDSQPSRPIRHVLGEITVETGFKPVALVAVDATWTALRFKRV